MASGRMLRRSISTCEDLADCSILARLLYTWGLPHTTDWGVLPGSPRKLCAMIFPLNPELAAELPHAMKELLDRGLWRSFEHDGAAYIYYPTFDRYQDVRRRSCSPRDGMPLPPDSPSGLHATSGKFREVPDTSRKSPEVPDNDRKCAELPDTSRNFPELPDNCRPREGKGREEKRTPPLYSPPKKQGGDSARRAADMKQRLSAARSGLDPDVIAALDGFMAIAAAENKSERITVGRELSITTALLQLREELGPMPWLYGMHSAIEHAAPNVNYVRKAAQSYARTAAPGRPAGQGHVSALFDDPRTAIAASPTGFAAQTRQWLKAHQQTSGEPGEQGAPDGG